MKNTKDKIRKCSHKDCKNVVEVTGYYCEKCRKEYNRMSYKKRSHIGYFLYEVLDGDYKVEYVGVTEGLKTRIKYSHISGNSNIKELMMSEDWEYIKYLDITNIVENRNELLMLENSLIDLHKPKWNDYKNNIRNMDKLREFSLISEIYSLDKKWKLYCTREEIRAKAKDKKRKLLKIKKRMLI